MTDTNQQNEAPERLIICTDGHRPTIADWAKDQMKACDFEYIRADLARVDPPAAPTLHWPFAAKHDNCAECNREYEPVPEERDRAVEDRLWEALKQHSCKNPDEAKLIVFLSEKKFREAAGPVLATVRQETWRAATLVVDTAPGCHSAGKWYIDPVALIQRMNDALESAAKQER